MPAASGALLDVVSPVDGAAFAAIAASDAADVDAAVAAARAAFEGAWSALTATERGRLLVRLGAAVEAEADALAELEMRDLGKPLRQARADAVALARYLEYYGSAADKLHGDVIPYLGHAFRRGRARAARGHRAHRPVELPDADLRPLGRGGARGRQRRRRQARRGCVADDPARRRARPRDRPAGRRPQRGDGPRPHGGRGAGRASGHRLPVLHGQPRDRHRGAERRRPQPCRRHAGARRQVRPGAVRGCGSRPRPAGRRQRDHPERRPDLLGRQPPPRRGAAPSRPSSAPSRSASASSGPGARTGTRISGR